MSKNGTNSLAHIKGIIFDYGEVLCLAPTDSEAEASARIMGLPVERYRELWLRHRDAYDRGDFAAEAYWKMLARDAGIELNSEQLRQLANLDVQMWSRINPAMIKWLKELSAAGIRMAVLSNMHLDMIVHARKNFSWLDLLHHHTFSAEVRLIKPDPAIYDHCIQGLGTAPAETLFLDDREVNVNAARARGLHALQFRSISELRGELEAGGFPVLPPVVD